MLHLHVVIIDLPEQLTALDLERAEVVLGVRIVVVIERVELAHRVIGREREAGAERVDAAGDHDMAAAGSRVAAEVVVEIADRRDPLVAFKDGHFSVSPVVGHKASVHARRVATRMDLRSRQARLAATLSLVGSGLGDRSTRARSKARTRRAAA